MITLSVVIPVFNEEDCIEKMYLQLSDVLQSLNDSYEIIFVNDGSIDNSPNILNAIQSNDINVKILHFSRNFGHQAAITAGTNYASGDALVTIDADLQDPPYVILEMIKKWLEGYDIVYGKRIKREGETFLKKATAKLYYRFLHSVSDYDLPLDCGDFKLLDKKVYFELNKLKEKNRYLRGLIAWMGYRHTFVTYIRNKRYAGKTKYSLCRMIKLAENGIFSFSTKSLKLTKYIGGFFSLIGFVSLIWLAIQTLIASNSYGWQLILATICFTNGIIIFILGIIGEYIARIYDETKNRPLYIIKDKIGF